MLSIIVLGSINLSAQNTYYFAPSAGKAKGQFITFIGDICFESNKSGKSVGHGKLTKNVYQSKSSKTVFVGDSYWGSKTKFTFNANKTALTITTSNGKTLSYTRKTPPSGVTTCALVRKRSGDNTPGYTPDYSMPSGGYYNPGVSSPTPSTPSNEQRNHRNTQQKPRKCVYCKGNGRISKYDSAPSSFGIDHPRERCNECGEWYDPDVFLHYHTQCSHCGGTGLSR